MRKIKTGELLWKFRNEKGISARSLSKGLCVASAIANYESGERLLDPLLLERFLERMGIVSSNFALMLNEEEYAYYMWKDQCYRAVENRSWRTLECLLDAKEGTKIVGNAKIQEQFYFYMKAVLIAEKYGQYEKAGMLLLDAAHKTIPNIFQLHKDKVCLGELEIQIILLYLYYSMPGTYISKETADRLFQELADYSDREYVENGIKVKNYVRIVCLWVKYGNPDMGEDRKIKLCENALQLLQKQHFFFDITELMEIYIPLLKTQKSPKVSFYTKQYEAFGEIMSYAGVEPKFRPEVMGTHGPKLYLISEYLQYKRREKGFTQEKASEGICEPETYSRLENGVRSPSPTNMIALSERLEMGWHFYQGELDTDNRKVYRLKKEQRSMAIKGQWQECLNILKKMEQLLDMKLPLNLQYVKSNETQALHRMKSISSEEAYEQDMKWLQLTTQLDLNVKGIVYYSDTELEIIGHMAQLLREMKRNTEAIELLETVIRQMSQSKVDISFHWVGISFVTRVLSGLYFSVNEYQKAYDTAYRIYKETVRYYSGGNLVTMLDSMSDSLEHMGTQHSEEYKKLCRLAYYVADFYDIQYAKDFLRDYYEKNYEHGYDWY